MCVTHLGRPCKVFGKLKVERRKVTATFSSRNPNAAFVCRLNQNQYEPCKCIC